MPEYLGSLRPNKDSHRVDVSSYLFYPKLQLGLLDVLKFWTDAIDRTGAHGWVFSEDGASVTVEAWCQETLLGSALASQPRADVHAAHAQFPSSYLSGFFIPFASLADGPMTIEIKARKNRDENRLVIGGELVAGRLPTTDEMGGALLAFPPQVLHALSTSWTEFQAGLGHEELQNAFADHLIRRVHRVRDGQPDVVRYLRYLRAVWAHIGSVCTYFPATNQNKGPQDKDYMCLANSAEEMISIAHHLYVLKASGVAGEFAEFGCFKGFSSSMLSYACNLLGMRMHIFDSFEGLPASDSNYYNVGDFSGGFEEVGENIAKFGAIDAITFHKGFFNDTLRRIEMPKLACLWMDVDLDTSARDVMTVADKVDPRGTIFSHECAAENFRAGNIVSPISPDHVIPAILDRFNALGSRLTGRFIHGNTGAFWRASSGIPVLSCSALQKIAKAV